MTAKMCTYRGNSVFIICCVKQSVFRVQFSAFKIKTKHRGVDDRLPLTLKTTIDEVLRPLHLLRSYFLDYIQILRSPGIKKKKKVTGLAGWPWHCKHGFFVNQSRDLNWWHCGLCSAYLQGLYTRGNEVTYHPNLGTRLWVCWKKTGSWSGLIDVLDHCQLHKQKNFGNVFLMLHGVIKNTPTKGVIKWNFNVFYLKLQSNYLQMLKG